MKNLLCGALTLKNRHGYALLCEAQSTHVQVAVGGHFTVKNASSKTQSRARGRKRCFDRSRRGQRVVRYALLELQFGHSSAAFGPSSAAFDALRPSPPQYRLARDQSQPPSHTTVPSATKVLSLKYAARIDAGRSDFPSKSDAENPEPANYDGNCPRCPIAQSRFHGT